MNRLKLLIPICALGFLFFACEAESVEEALEANLSATVSDEFTTEERMKGVNANWECKISCF